MKPSFMYLPLALSLLCAAAPAQWVQTGGPTGGTIQCLAINPTGNGSTTLFAGTRGGGVFRTTDDGSNWTAINEGLTKRDVRALAIDSGAGGMRRLFSGTDGGVFVSTDNGTHWTPANTGMTNLDVRALLVCPNGSGGTYLYAGTFDGAFLSRDNGSNWASVGLKGMHVFALAFEGANLFAGADGFGVYRSTNYGATWLAANAGLKVKSVLCFAAAPKGPGGHILFVGTNTGGISFSTNSGTSWTPVNALSLGVIPALAVYPNEEGGTTLFASMCGEGVFRSRNYGVIWDAVNNGLPNRDVYALAADTSGLGGTKLIAGGAGGGIFVSTNDGVNWAVCNAGLVSASITVLATCPQESGGSKLFAGTLGAGVFSSTNGGGIWSPDSTGLTNRDVTGLAVISGGSGERYLFAGTHGGVFRSTDDGVSWSPVNTGFMYTEAHSLAAVSDGAGGTNLIAGCYGETYVSTNKGTSWKSVLRTGYAKATVIAASGTHVALVLQSQWSLTGWMYFSSDGGSSWRAVSLEFAKYPSGYLKLQALAFTGTDLLAGTDGGVFRSSDDGISWSPVTTGLTSLDVRSLGAFSRGAEGTIVFAGTPQGVFLSTNNGTNWSEANSGLTGVAALSFALLPANNGGMDLYAGTDGASVWCRPLAEMITADSSNLVRNPGFELGPAAWDFYSNGDGEFTDHASGAGSLHAGRLDIRTEGTNTQLYQSGIPLRAGKRYLLTFNAYSSAGHDLAVSVHKHGVPFTSYGLDGREFDLDTGWKRFMTEFTAGGFADSTGDARLKFWLAPYASAGETYFIDDVVLRETEPNLLVNGSFAWGVEPWRFFAEAGGSFTAQAAGLWDAGSAYLKVTVPAANIQLYQDDIPLSAGTRYRLTFRARSKWGYDLSVFVHKHGAPFTNYGMNGWEVDLGSTWQTFAKEFTAENFAGAVRDARLKFWLAPYAQGGDEYFIDDVVLVPVGVENPGVSLTGTKDRPETPAEISLQQNYPNPFNPVTDIRYQIAGSRNVKLAVYDLLGREVAVLVNEKREAGEYEVRFDGTGLASGVYLYRMVAGGYVETKKLLLVR